MERILLLVVIPVILVAGFSTNIAGEQKSQDKPFDNARIQRVIASHRSSWGGMNVPEADGKALYDIIVKKGYRNALEIGTSNGYSGLWIAWALSKTGGKLTTIEIDKGRHSEALTYFREAGLSEIIDAMLGDAHELVSALPGPFDFVFCDADKEWYENYLKAVLPKITAGGCFAAHNVSDYSSWGGRRRGGFRRGGESGGYLEYVRSLPNLETSVLNIPGSAGLAVSYRK